ncbi:MAG: carboxypeptidase regulatory-like domain-containing protein [Nitrospirae bacterium]|nr:carboxypeptidase regulatory-like domain-containing protein [Nitrospirota bacterium]
MKIKTVMITIWAVAVWLVPFSAARAYEEKTVTDGGTITGKVIFKGPVPPPRPFGLIVYPDMEVCERNSDGKGHRLLQDFTVSKDGGFQDVVVVVEEVGQGKPFPLSGPTIAIKDCSFSPFMSVIRDRQSMTFQNRDGVIHDIQTYAIEETKRGDRIFDRAALPDSTLTQEVRVPKGQKIVWTQCGKHSFMQTWFYAVDNPYYAITSEAGGFSIRDLPPGRYRVTAWHPFMKLREQTIEISAHSQTVVNFEFGK